MMTSLNDCIFRLAISGSRSVPAAKSMALKRAIAGVLLVTALSACTTYSGIEEFTTYREAYSVAADTGDQILDKLAAAERRLFDIAYPLDPEFGDFDPGDAAYISEGADPPATASYRNALLAIESYNEALFRLANGDAASEIVASISRLGAVGTNAATELASFGAGSPTTIAAATSVNTILAAFAPLATEMIAFGTRDAFREQLLENAPLMTDAIEAVRASTPQIFDSLRDQIIAAANSDPTRFGLTDVEVEQIKDHRRTIAAWVILLNGTQEAFQVAVDAAQADAGEGSFDGMLLASEGLVEAIRSARMTLAESN